ncbi:efflux RND transporter periplasmic adaptor subunit [Oscillochloris sp. ZM17-4]|uniref:efflux RND transporter periplasmic adaptor subunit n=1 Tax=Oscillochloris sp. ZM17-4 TaxID=2866714 RepID=UPI001C73B42A|nr:efflux RND transporter periplasmic adaptor subunit [Oscillochloris sp. ZM17-4]MBX0326708.1 efflux RND transporter periplasmic adaptor subunit [Oscillochloris sp. ZM17-4]
MASAETPRKKKNGRRRLILIIGGVLLVVAACAGGAFYLAPKPPAAGTLPEGWQTVAASSGTIASTVSATGNVEPAAEAKLRFSQSGTVTEILVREGDAVQAGAPLARIDSAGLRLSLEQAQADLRQAQADYEDLLAGASAQDLAEANARLEQARSQYQQAATSVSAADISAARADLTSAQARLSELQSGPANDELASANEQVQRAQSTLDQARVDLAAAKERARVDMEAKANALRNAQDTYSKVYWDNRRLESLPGDLPQDRKDQEAQALRAVDDGGAALSAAQTAYEQAKQDEINTLQANEASLKSAIASRDKLIAGPKADALADARAAVQRAQAKLAQLTGANRASELASSQASVEIAQAGLDKLTADPSTATLASREAAVVRAEVGLKQAQRNLDLATLTAPFAATISAIDMNIGEPADGTAIIAIVDLSSFHIDVPIDELDIAQVQPGQRVQISLDALPGAEIGGAVDAIAPQATRSDQGTTTYAVTVKLDEGSAGVRPGMTAVVAIVTSQKDDTLLVPRRAVRAEGGKSYVLIFDPAGKPEVSAGSVQPASTRQEVTIGLSNSESVEILSGLQAGDEVLVQDVVSTFNPAGN